MAKRSKPALKMGHLADLSGGDVVDIMQPVTGFTAGFEELADAQSVRFAVKRVLDGICEITAKVAPDLKLPKTVNGSITELGTVTTDEAGMDVREANDIRVDLNSYIATAAYLVNQWAEAEGIHVPYRCHASGDFMVEGGALKPLASHSRKPSRPGLTKVEFDAALKCWGDCIATLANVVNAAKEPDAVAPSDPATN